MAPKRFAGDANSRLPKGMKEPYRLWFEFLKLALRIPGIRVDRSLYQPWGDVEGEDFDKWWQKNWSELFAIDAPTRVLTTLDQAEWALRDPTVVLLRVSLTETKKRRLEDVTDALSAVPLSPNLKSKARKTPLFTLSTKRSMNLKTLRGMLRFYQLYEENHGDIEATSIAYFNWSRGWNEKVRSKRWKRPLVYEPPFLASFVEEITDKRERKENGASSKNTRDYDDLRNQARRFLRKGEVVLRNVAKGEFPGTIN